VVVNMLSARIFVFTLVNVSTVLFNLTHGLLLILFGGAHTAPSCSDPATCPQGALMLGHRAVGIPLSLDRLGRERLTRSSSLQC
jgi:hypothetical protein